MKKSIAIDMDDTVADTLSRHIEWYHERFGVAVDRNNMEGCRIYDVVSVENLEIVKNFPNDPEFFRDLPVIENAIEVIRELSSRYEIYFASAAMEHPTSFSAKYEWLQKNFPFISDMNYIFCGYKGMLNCNYLIDDSSRHLDVFAGEGLLFDAPHNRKLENYSRVNSWEHVAQVFA